VCWGVIFGFALGVRRFGTGAVMGTSFFLIFRFSFVVVVDGVDGRADAAGVGDSNVELVSPSPYQSSIIVEKPDRLVLKLFRCCNSASEEEEVDDDESSDESSLL